MILLSFSVGALSLVLFIRRHPPPVSGPGRSDSRGPLAPHHAALGNGLSKIADKVFRIGHLGDFNDLMLMGTLSGVEMGLELSGIPYRRGGVQAALGYLTGQDQKLAGGPRIVA